MVKVIESRPVSNAIAEKLAVTHQSPQLILLHSGQEVWNASHHNITGENIESALGEI
jgi:bacillithiol system protein YtxJ